MEYFDFEDASHLEDLSDLDEISSTCPQANEGEVQSCFEPLFFDKTASLPVDAPALPGSTRLNVVTKDIETQPHPNTLGLPDLNGVYPMFRAKEPCDLCRRMGLDCFIAQRGTLLHGCTCCISLYKECSFTHRRQAGNYMQVFPGISEDVQVIEGTVTGQRALKSYDDSRPRKNGARFCRDAVKILKNWLAEHNEHPYPTDKEKDELKQLTGLKRSQISNWLANARRRGKVRPSSGPSSPVLGAIDIPRPGPPGNNGMQDLNPLERWKASPPEHEAASATAIARAVAAAPLPPRNSTGSGAQGSGKGSRKSSSNDSSFSMFQAPSISSLETGRSSTSDLSFASGPSHRSRGSFASSLGEKDRRRRRRAPAAQRMSVQASKSRSARIFQCTFCADTFPAKYDWQRHEKSLHLALEKWTCCPNGGTVESDGIKRCVFCREPNPSAAHLETHNFMACQEKTLSERTFYRKDHLRQHLKLLHSAKFDPLIMETWKSTTTEIKSACGFCPQLFTTWQQRADHLAAHFRNGSDMRDWTSGWGFEPHVERLVENAVPPYLNAQERASMDPFVAKANTTPSDANDTSLTFGTSSSDTYRIEKDSNCWRRLEMELSKYIVKQKQLGIIPTDKMLQDQARMIIFNDDDPWNQTSADNAMWLGILKKQHGINGDQPVCPATKLEELPMMPPYAISGGLKNTRAGHNGSMEPTSGNFTPEFTNVMASSGPLLDSTMDIDYDQLDLGALDLGLMEDLDFEQPDATGGFDMSGMVAQGVASPNFGTFEMPQYPALEANPMSDADLQELGRYMAGFQ